jgi:hypothetical protein
MPPTTTSGGTPKWWRERAAVALRNGLTGDTLAGD